MPESTQYSELNNKQWLSEKSLKNHSSLQIHIFLALAMAILKGN